ncbi:MAG: RluA family pseudouridine synthase [bacterium]
MKSNKYVVEGKVGRIDNFLTGEIKTVSRSKISEFIKTNGVTVNGEQVSKPSVFLKEGDVVEVDKELFRCFVSGDKEKRDLGAFGSSGDEGIIKPEPMDLEIIYEDSDILVLDKPSGIVVHPGVRNYSGTLVNGLAYYFEQKGEKLPNRVGLVHRLDKEVSGLMVIAKNNQSLSMLSDQFRGDNVGDLKAKKLYWAVVETNKLKPNMNSKELLIEGYISRSRRDRKKFVLSKYDNRGGKYSNSYARLVKKGKKYSLIEVRLGTGRTHQIRVHLSSIGMPIIGDIVYKGKKMEVEGIALRCIRLEFIHPKVYKVLIQRGFVIPGRSEVFSGRREMSKVDREVFSAEDVPLGVEV